MKHTSARTFAALFLAALFIAGCSAEVTVSDDEASVTIGDSDVTDADVDSSEVADADEPDSEVADADSDATTAAAPTTTAEPVAPQPVTASTVHESRSDDFPDILAAQATPEGDGTWRFDVTVSSPYDTPQRYADAWRVVGPDGTEYGIRVLTHDHASEQPFTRSQSGIPIPADVSTVTIEGRDQANGWGGGFLTVDLSAG